MPEEGADLLVSQHTSLFVKILTEAMRFLNLWGLKEYEGAGTDVHVTCAELIVYTDFQQLFVPTNY